jgi:hypothetical protein
MARGMHSVLDMLPTTWFTGGFLVLVLGFRLPVVDMVGTEDISDAIADDLGTIVGDEFAHGASTLDFVFKSVDELGFELNAMDADDLCVLSNKDDDILDACECGDIGRDDIA